VTETVAPPFDSAASVPSPNGENEAKTWRPLRFLTISRLLIAALFVLLHHLERLPLPLGSTDPELFYFASLAYLIFSLLALFPLFKRQPRFMLQLTSHILADVVIITILMHASGGVASGVGMLLVISVANGSIIAGGRTPGLFAAMASISILIEQVYTGLTHTAAETNYPFAGILGMTLFATAILAHVLARRVRESEALAHQRSVDLANMAQLTDYIIQHMQTGIMVVDPEKRVRLMNSSASRLLGTSITSANEPLSRYSPQLLRLLQDWEHSPGSAARPMNPEGKDGTLELLPQFMHISQQRQDGTLIFIEDAATMTRRAQQLKLASLGRLTASIAHEIRNPLGALSHAAALLVESPELDPHDQRLTEIIRDQSQRINTVVENVLQLGRSDRTHLEEITMKPWLEHFLHELEQICPDATGAVSLQVEPPQMKIFFDSSHLHQILTNLCQNGLRHADSGPAPIKVQLYAGLTNRELGYLDIIDTGPGISEENRAHIFEPFFTTESNGTGLGLYLARELSVCNQAQLRYEPTDSGQSRFRLLFRIANGVTPIP
jgi:two-component system sensor histidine kinase PilS (NtrC family)